MACPSKSRSNCSIYKFKEKNVLITSYLLLLNSKSYIASINNKTYNVEIKAKSEFHASNYWLKSTLTDWLLFTSSTALNGSSTLWHKFSPKSFMNSENQQSSHLEDNANNQCKMEQGSFYHTISYWTVNWKADLWSVNYDASVT